MINRNYTLIRESFDCSTYEKEQMMFAGKLINVDSNNIFDFAFKIEKQIMRMTITFKNNGCVIIQKYPDSDAIIELFLNKKGKYTLNLANGYSLKLITEASFIKYDDFKIELKYNLYDDNNGKIISMNEIKIVGEGEIC